MMLSNAQETKERQELAGTTVEAILQCVDLDCACKGMF